MTWWKWLLLLVAGTAALVWILGAMIPRGHVATCTARFRAAPQRLYELVRDVAGATSWRKDLEWVELLAPREGKPAWAETSSWGKVTYVLDADEPGRRLAYRIADDSLPYGGTWTFRFEPDGAGTRLSITEDGFVEPKVFRLLARFVFGYHRTLETYLRSLAAGTGDTVTVERS